MSTVDSTDQYFEQRQNQTCKNEEATVGQTFLSEELFITLEIINLLLTLLEERYLLGYLFAPVPVILMLAISNLAPFWAPRQI